MPEREFTARLGTVVQGRYKLTQFLGRGGMGAVFLCEDLRLAGKRWALKEMLASDAEVLELVQESFRREAAILSRLRHRNLPMIVDYFIEDNRQYLVMEYLDGETLAKAIQREGPANEVQALRWGLELAQVLDYLHRQEKPIIFRDLKPDNIILTDDRHIKLIDFGLARQFDPVKRRDTQCSGSVGYAPPEQWEDSTQTDERSDVYSLGAVLFYILTARPPSPVYGSQRLRPYRPKIDQGAEAIVLRCLQPTPSERYDSSGELIRDLLLWLSRQKVVESAPVAPASSTPEALATTSKPHRSSLPPERLLVPEAISPSERLSLIGEYLPSSLGQLLKVATLCYLLSGGISLYALNRPLVDMRVSDPLTEMLQENADKKQQARQSIVNGQYSDAVSILDALVTRSPKDAESQILKNNAYALLQKRPIYKIPVVTSMTGKEREGFQLLYGLALAQTEINQVGLAGHSIYIDIFDCQSLQDKALNIATTMVKNSDYAIAIGPFSSQQTIAVAPVFEDAGLPILAPNASDPRVWTMGKNILTAADSDTNRVTLLAKHFSQLGLKQGVVIHNEESIVSRSMANEFIEAFSASGGQILQSLAYTEGGSVNQDGTQQFVRPEEIERVLKKVRELPTEFVFLAEFRSDLVPPICQAIRRMGLKFPIACQSAVSPDSALLRANPPLDGLLSSTYFDPDSAQPEVIEFSKKMANQFDNLKPSHREALAYDSLKLVAKSIETVGFDRAKLRKYLHEVGNSRAKEHGVSGDFSPSKRLDLRQPYLAEVKGGKFVVTRGPALTVSKESSPTNSPTP